MISRRTLLATAAAAPLASLASRSAHAAYPDKPMRLIVPFAAGGNADFVGRLVSDFMAQTLGQPIVIDNRSGAGGSLGAEQAAKAAPDGYTLFLGSNGPLTVNPFVQAKLDYDPLKDFIAGRACEPRAALPRGECRREGEDHPGIHRAVEVGAGEPRHLGCGLGLAHDARALRRRDRRQHHACALSRRRQHRARPAGRQHHRHGDRALDRAAADQRRARCACSASPGIRARRSSPTCRP